MPTPNEGETQKEFISRCIPIVIEEGTAKDNEQAAAICYSIWERRNETKWVTVAEMRQICPACAEKMIAKGLERVKIENLAEDLGIKLKAGNIENLTQHLVNKYGDDPGFFTKCMEAEELADYDEEARSAICARAHYEATGKWPTEKSNQLPSKLEYSTPMHIDELKSVGDDWEVSGYVSVFNNIDLGNDIVIPGAFKGSLNSGRKVRFLFSHDPRLVLGVPKALKEDSKGLFGRFKISKTKLGEDTRQLLQDGAIDSFSYGYNAADWEYKDGGVRELKSIDLYEASLVSIPMNPEAVVTGYKAYMTLADRSKFIQTELEQLLADLRGLKDRPLSETKRQELAELLDQWSGLDAVRSNLMSIVQAGSKRLVGPQKTKYELAEARKRLAYIIKE